MNNDHSESRPLGSQYPFGRILLALLTLLAANLIAPDARSLQAQAPQAKSRPNIVFFLIDDLGWTDVGFIHQRAKPGQPTFYQTPNIDALASRSTVFTNAYANAPNCAPSRACLMSGQWSARHGIYTVGTAERGKSKNRSLIPVQNEVTLDESYVTLAESLKSAGYATAAMGKWHLGETPETQGFDVNVAGTHWGSPSGGGYHSPFHYPNLDVDEEGIYLTDKLTDHAVQFVEDHREKPFFLYLSHYAVHTPLQGRSDLVKKYRALPVTPEHQNPKYAAMIESVDHSVGRVLDKLRELKLEENTIIVFFSDNGGHIGATLNRPLRGAKGMLYEGGIRVPMCIHWPHAKNAPSQCDVPVQGTDFYPTLLSMANIDPPQGYGLDGEDITPLFDPTIPAPERTLYWHFPAYLEGKGDPAGGPFRTTPASAIRKGDWKLIHWYAEDRYEMYNVTNDIQESRNQYSQTSEKAKELKTELDSWVQRTNGFVPTQPNPEYTPGTNR